VLAGADKTPPLLAPCSPRPHGRESARQISATPRKRPPCRVKHQALAPHAKGCTADCPQQRHQKSKTSTAYRTSHLKLHRRAVHHNHLGHERSAEVRGANKAGNRTEQRAAANDSTLRKSGTVRYNERAEGRNGRRLRTHLGLTAFASARSPPSLLDPARSDTEYSTRSAPGGGPNQSKIGKARKVKIRRATKVKIVARADFQNISDHRR